MKTITLAQTPENLGKNVTVHGWVHNLRDMGKIVFFDLRDSTGLLQVVCSKPAELPKLGQEYVLEVSGQVRERDPKFYNDKLPTGKVELGADEVRVLNVASELPFDPQLDTKNVSEEVRLKYRYLDLRSDRMNSNLKLRHNITRYIRNFLDQRDFTEVETPLLTKGTPEGAREYIVPSRLHEGEFYVLPQSPQQFKQLLMVAGLERYYQIAKCLRDEDLRGDRQPEFTQLDLEMSFVTQEDVMRINEELVTSLIGELFPDKKLASQPFTVLSYHEAIKAYGTDKPDLRKNPDDPNELAFAWVVDFPMFEINNETSKVDAVHHPFTAPHPDDAKLVATEPTKVRAAAYDLVLNGYEIAGGSIRIHQADLQEKVFELLGLGKSEIEQRFGHMLKAFTYGAPPHGGIAYGLDRLVMILAGEPNIREVIAFPKTGEGRDLMVDAPSPLEAGRLKDANIQLASSMKKST